MKISSIKKIGFPLLLTALLIFLDQFTKYLAKTGLAGKSIKIIDGVFELCYTENRGMAFGLFQGGKIVFLIITVLAVAVMLFLYVKLLKNLKFTAIRVILIFIWSGAIGNLIDRSVNSYVVDFMYISLIDFPVFNLADIFVSWSAVLLVILLIFKYKEEDFKGIFHES